MKSRQLLNKSAIANNHGMTLIEIIIVVAIIAGISTTLITNVLGQSVKAQVSQTKIKMSAIASALDLYSVDCGEYPESLEDLVDAPSSCDSWGPEPYLDKKKKKLFEDAFKGKFVYERSGSDYELLSLGKDKREGGEGSDEDIYHE